MGLAKYYKVSGRAQGVFFRASTRDKALQLGLSGWVRNMPNGGVELLACGEESSLTELENWLWQGPRHARVSGVLVREAEPLDFHGFEVRY